MAPFVTFEGGEGSGKTVQARALYLRLKRLAIPVLLTHEPGGTRLGERLARALKWGQGTAISPIAELLMFNACRAQLVDEVIRPNLKNGVLVISDRFADSTLAYQSYGRGLDREIVQSINASATRGLRADLTILMDIPAEDGLTRKKDRKPDRFELENIEFHNRVRRGYLELAAGEPGRWLVLDARKPVEGIRDLVWQAVSKLISSRRV